MLEVERRTRALPLKDVRGLKFSVVNHGCKVNRVEADAVAAALAARGAVLGQDDASLELVVVNTCTVTAEADKKARKAIRHALKASPHALVAVTGCGAAIDPAGYAALGDRVLVVGREQLLAQASAGSAPRLRSGPAFRTRVGIKIQDGCDHACTYCIVHVARGRARSVQAESVLDEARAYFEAGTKELVLTGIDLGSYRCGQVGLAELAGKLVDAADAACAPGEFAARIRASSLEPMSIGADFVDLLARADGRICRHLHVPLQSGSTRVLAEMARPYTAAEYLELALELHRRVPAIALTTDIIVGFPGETDRDFERTLDIARRCEFSKIHVFPYSKRAGTPAAERPDQVAPEVIRDRARQLRALSQELRAADRARRAGSTELALVEPRSALAESYHELPAPSDAKAGSLMPLTFA